MERITKGDLERGNIILFSTNKEKGMAGLSIAIAYFGSNGYVVSIPLNDTQDYDLVVEKDNKFYKVQCRSSGSLNSNGLYYSLHLRSVGGANGGTCYGTLKDSNADLCFAVTEDMRYYLFPVSIITQGSRVVLNESFDKYLVTI